jgi:hypothetical protein
VATTRIKLHEAEVDLVGAEDAEVDTDEEIVVVVVVGGHVGTFRPGTYDWYIDEV